MAKEESDSSSLNLSCESSDFEDDNDVITERTVTSDDDDDEEISQQGRLGVLPYQFEPVDSDPSSSDSENQETEEESRMNSTDWCKCGHCSVMPTPRECICCHGIQEVTAVRQEFPEHKCIIEHPGFGPICLDPFVLRVAYYGYRQHYGERPEGSNERNRYVAYRQFVRFCWGHLGRHIRVILPACAVCKIRKTFPDPNQEYVGFLDAAE